MIQRKGIGNWCKQAQVGGWKTTRSFRQHLFRSLRPTNDKLLWQPKEKKVLMLKLWLHMHQEMSAVPFLDCKTRLIQFDRVVRHLFLFGNVLSSSPSSWYVEFYSSLNRLTQFEYELYRLFRYRKMDIEGGKRESKNPNADTAPTVPHMLPPPSNWLVPL